MEVENSRPSLGIRTAKPLQPVKGCGGRPYPLKNFWRNLPCSRGGRTIAASPTGRDQMKARLVLAAAVMIDSTSSGRLPEGRMDADNRMSAAGGASL